LALHKTSTQNLMVIDEKYISKFVGGYAEILWNFENEYFHWNGLIHKINIIPQSIVITFSKLEEEIDNRWSCVAERNTKICIIRQSSFGWGHKNQNGSYIISSRNQQVSIIFRLP
jgi:hypothetical protein